jgi:hypothetical protein
MYTRLRRNARGLALAAWLAALAGCGRDPLDFSGLPDGGLGGQGGSGGSSSNPGMSPDKPIPSIPGCVIPGCLVDLTAPCSPSGTCRVSNDGARVAMCYANGVRMVTTQKGSQTSASVTKPNGDLCYTLLQDASRPAVTEFLFRNASGGVVATAVMEGARMSVLCSGRAAPVVIDLACAEAAVSGGAPTCTPGACK